MSEQQDLCVFTQNSPSATMPTFGLVVVFKHSHSTVALRTPREAVNIPGVNN